MASRPMRFHEKLRILGWVSYLLIFLPVLTDYLERGEFSRSPRAWITEVSVGLLILGFTLVLRRTHREIVKLNELRRALTDSIIHDLRNPMASIMGSLSALKDEGLPAGSKQTLLDSGLRACHYQVELLEDLLDVDRMEEARLPLRLSRVAPRELLDACAAKVAQDARSAGVALAVDCPEGLPPLRADPDLLGRVLLNLVWNALKYTPSAGRITLRCALRPEGWLFEVEDSGQGIPPEHLPKLFQKYYRVEGRGASPRRGTGLGLYFCRLAVEAHGGGIWASSRAGSGTLMSVLLPPTPPTAEDDSEP